ncbi:MAG: hypothetical protein H5U07_00265 [Candidatus Aminicenantes bacterium]|nr:hypothetical protein [Candidatus Aminicenantes bacterium]
MFFGITSVLLIIALNLRLTFGRFLKHLPEPEREISADNFKEYINWIVRWKLSFLRLKTWDRALDYLINWAKKEYPGWAAWVFYGLVLSYAYLALSGFIFAWFVPRGLFGFPLLLHVAAGALYAICLTIILFIKARVYLPDKVAEKASKESSGFYCPFLRKSWPRPYFQAAAFWVFVLAGFLLASSTLGSMLPYFNYPAQIFFFHLHRWSALASVLAACLAIDVMIVE